MTNFVFEAAVPKFVALTIQPATGQVLPPNTMDLVTQTMTCVNSSNGEKALVMKLRIGYVFGLQTKMWRWIFWSVFSV